MQKNEYVTAARANEIPDQRGISVRVRGRVVALFRAGDEIFALDGSCPHRGAPLGAGTIENGAVFCPMHAWSFDLRTGACRDNPDKPVRSFPVRVVDGEVQIQL